MKLKLMLCQLLFLIVIIMSSCGKKTIGCKDATATNYDISADESCNGCCTYPPKQGGVLFYIADPMAITRCGNFVITLSNGKTSTITRHYDVTPPANCVNLYGGYFLLDVGTYQYTITSARCAQATGTITVTEGCNKVAL